MSFKPFLAYSASAGSGKTFALSVRYIALLFMGESPNSILAATFTKKAAGEMHQRVVDSLRNLGDNPAFLEAVSQESGLSKEALFAKQPQVLARFLGSGGYIVTLDSFFGAILRSASLELGLEPDFVTKEQGEEELEKHFLDEVQAQGLLSDLVKLAINIEDKRFLKIFDLMQGFYNADPLLPTIKYQIDNISALEQEIDNTRHTLHQMVVASGAAKSAINNFVPMATKALFAKGVFEKQSLLEHRNYKKYVQINPQIDETFLSLKALLGEWIILKEAIVLENLFQIYDYYKNATISSVKRSGVLTFDDVNYFTYRLLYESMSREFLYFKIDSKFNHILLDEFQDTSTLQFLLLQPLIDEIFAGIGQSAFKSFFYVGDTKQSLYRFRGGVEELFEKVAARYGVNIEQMDTNYRSSKSVVAQVNRWFEPTMQGYIPQKSREGASEGYVEVIEVQEPDALIDEGVKQAKMLLDLGVSVDDIAFLVNTNKEGQNLQEACEHEGIATLLKTSSSLKNMPKIASIVAMCEYLFFGEKIDAQAMLLGIDKRLEEVDVSWFSPFMSPLQVVDRLVCAFGYFDEDLNILKLLDFASTFSDIPTFIEEFHTSKIAVASNSVHGANIMTIHGSKGLEFEYVILLDKLKRKKADTSLLLYRYDEGLHIDKIFYRSKGREHFDATYAELIASRKTSSAKDSMNVLYVALTRAVEGMIVIRKAKDSIFDSLGMQLLQVGTLKVEKKSHDEEKPLVEPITISSYGTQIMPKHEEQEEKDYQAMLFGSALHYALEMLGNFDTKGVKLAIVSMRNRFGKQLDNQMVQKIEKRIQKLIEKEAFQQLLADAIRFDKEQSLSYEGEIKQIDLLLEYPERYVVVEYKSSQKYAFKHHQQVAHYTKAIEAITNKPTDGVIVYLLEDKIILERH